MNPTQGCPLFWKFWKMLFNSPLWNSGNANWNSWLVGKRLVKIQVLQTRTIFLFIRAICYWKNICTKANKCGVFPLHCRVWLYFLEALFDKYTLLLHTASQNWPIKECVLKRDILYTEETNSVCLSVWFLSLILSEQTNASHSKRTNH